MISFQLSGASVQTLDALTKTIEARRKYMGETVSESAHAMMGQTLRSIRADTKVAKPNRVKASAVSRRGDLDFSYTNKGGYRMMCLRRKSGQRVAGDELGKVRYASDVRTVPQSAVKVFDFTDLDGERYLLAAPSKSSAVRTAKAIATRRVKRFAGLARRAVGVLMIKANTKGPAESASARVNAKAWAETRIEEGVAKTPAGAVYTLASFDNLRYAKLALAGGEGVLDAAAKKAVNKTVGMIQHRFAGKDFFAPGDLPRIFNDVKQRK